MRTRLPTLVTVFIALGCGQGPLPAPPSDALGQQAPWPTEQWSTVEPATMGMDAALLEQALDYAFEPQHHTQAVVIVRGGAIVAERYAPGRDADSFAASWSMGKSFTSALVGIAIDEGKIDGVDVPMTSFFPEWEGSDKAAITLRSVLQMQSGLSFREEYVVGDSEMVDMGLSGDNLAFMLHDVGVGAPPDTKWYYSSGDTMLLSGAIERATGMTAADYARDKLFGPMGMAPLDWWVDGAGHTLGYCCIDTTTRDFAKLGLLFLRDGQWDGSSLVSADWVDRSTTDTAGQFDGYAYQWWTADVDPNSPLPRDMFSAHGLDDQRIYVIPSLDLVVVRNSIYDKPPGEPVAEHGFIGKFLPNGMGTYGTKRSELWIDEGLMVPIVNSIEGVTPIDWDVADAATSGGDPAECRVEAAELGGYCEEVHGCVCDHCTDEFFACNADEGCQVILACALETGCRGVECMTACKDAINDNGGAFGKSATLALHVSDCSKPCATSCDGQ